MQNRKSDGGGGKDGASSKRSSVELTLDTILVELGHQIRAFRKTSRVTQQEIESRSGLSQSALSKIEKGSRNLKVRSLVQVAIGLGVKPSFLVQMVENGLQSGSNLSIAMSDDIAVITDDTVSPESVKQLTHEVGPRRTRASQNRRKLRSG